MTNREAHTQLPAPGGVLPRSGTLRVRVRYCECDPMGVVHHAAYVPWLEIGRTELLRGSGVSYADMERAGYLLVIVKLDVRYRRPARYDDLIEVRTKVTEASRVKLVHEYELAVVERDGAACEEVCVGATTTLACVGRDGRPREMPEWLRGVTA